MLPSRVAFSEVLLEVCRWTGFADAFTHLSEGLARAQDLHISICAVLLAEACNIGLAEVANPGIPALAPSRLSWVTPDHPVRHATAIHECVELGEQRQPWGRAEDLVELGGVGDERRSVAAVVITRPVLEPCRSPRQR
ncbi:MAG: Tn3 family transposase [Solirubrobacteraceae bacterium]